MPLSHYAGFIFDLDGTLVDTMPMHLAAWQQVADELGFVFDHEWMYQCGGIPSRKIAVLLNQQQGLNLDAEQVARQKNRYYVSRLSEAKAFPAMQSLLAQWHGKIPMALGTGSPRVNAQAVLKHTGLTGYLDAVVSADDVELHKPNPDTFLLAAELMGVEAERCLVFEDTQIGLQAAQAAGMDCVLIRDGEPQWPANALR